MNDGKNAFWSRFTNTRVLESIDHLIHGLLWKNQHEWECENSTRVNPYVTTNKNDNLVYIYIYCISIYIHAHEVRVFCISWLSSSRFEYSGFTNLSILPLNEMKKRKNEKTKKKKRKSRALSTTQSMRTKCDKYWLTKVVILRPCVPLDFHHWMVLNIQCEPKESDFHWFHTHTHTLLLSEVK